MSDPKSKARDALAGALDAVERHPRKIALAAFVLLGMLVACQCSHAQPVAGELTFTLTQATNADGTVTPSLLWTTNPRAARCVASGDWTGSRAVHRDTPLKLAAVTPPKVYTLTCYWPDTDARLSWQAPTENVDGTPLTDLAGYRVYYGNSEADLGQSLVLNDPALTERVVGPLAAGVWYFAMTSVNSKGQESARSGTVSATLGEATVAKTVTAEAKIPQPPAGVAVTTD